jgi:NTP pyrophosphatase (non-canonical NTP hydrolase)
MMSMTVNGLAKRAYDIAKEKGWHEHPNPLPEVFMKMVTEISEAMEEFRNNKPHFYVMKDGKPEVMPPEFYLPRDGKPEGILTELADCVIRIMDTCGEMGWDLENAIIAKMDFNQTREYKHGGKCC